MQALANHIDATVRRPLRFFCSPGSQRSADCRPVSWLVLAAALAAAAFAGLWGSEAPAQAASARQARVMVENRTSHALPVELQGNGSPHSQSDILPPGACRMYRLDCPARTAGIWLRQPAGSWTAKSLLESGYHYAIEGPGLVRQVGKIER